MQCKELLATLVQGLCGPHAALCCSAVRQLLSAADGAGSALQALLHLRLLDALAELQPPDRWGVEGRGGDMAKDGGKIGGVCKAGTWAGQAGAGTRQGQGRQG